MIQIPLTLTNNVQSSILELTRSQKKVLDTLLIHGH